MSGTLTTRGHRLTALAAVAWFSAAPAAQAHPIVGSWTSPTQFTYQLGHISDLDQQRSGLPGSPGGSMYCGPTTGMNMIIFGANHGFASLLQPGLHGDVWEQPAFYAAGTANIGFMGTLMGCSPTSGVSVQGFATGLRRWIGNRPISISYYMASGQYGPNLAGIAATALNRNLVAMAYGYYQVVGFMPGGVPVVARTGGHFVTVAGALRTGGVQKIWVRDPADEQPPQLLTQSPFVNREWNVQNGWVRILQPPLNPIYRYVTRMVPPAGQPVVLGQKLLLMDAVVYGTGRKVITVGPGGQLIVIGGGGALGGGDGLQCGALDFGGGPVLDAVGHPDQAGAVVIAGGDGGVAGAQGTTVAHFDPATGQTSTLARIDGATKLYFGRDRSFYVLAGDSVHRLELPIETEEEAPEPQDPPVAVVAQVPFAAQAMTYDDQADQLVLLSLTDRKLMRFAADLGGEPEIEDVPAEVPLGQTGNLAVNPEDGNLWIVSDASDSLYGLIAAKDPRGGLAVETLSLPRITAPRGVDFGDDGHMIVSAAGGIVELQLPDRGEGGWEVVADSPFERLTCEVGDVVRVDRGRTNFDPAVHDTPEWSVNIDPAELIHGDPVADAGCAGDLNGDHAVNALDLAIVLGNWGPALSIVPDLDGNGIVNGFDLATLLGQWGPCPAAAR